MTDFSVKPTLIGDRVILRPMVESDGDLLSGALDDPDLRRLTGTHADFTPEQVRAYCASRAEQTDRLDLAIVDRSTGAVVGEAVLNNWDQSNRSCGFRIAIGPAGRGRGLGTEATRLTVDHGFRELGLHRIELEVYAFNPRARHVYEKVGFVAEGVRREALYWDGEWIDAAMMSILAPEWLSEPAG